VTLKADVKPCYVLLPYKQKATKFRLVRLRILFSTVKSGDCIAFWLGFVAINVCNLSAKAAKKLLQSPNSVI
jgi:hypothetical protein